MIKERLTITLNETKNINRIGVWLEYKGYFKKCTLLKVVWWFIAIESLCIQLFLFSYVFFSKLSEYNRERTEDEH